MTATYETLEDLCTEYSRKYWLYIDIIEDYYLSDEEIITQIEKDLDELIEQIHDLTLKLKEQTKGVLEGKL